MDHCPTRIGLNGLTGRLYHGLPASPRRPQPEPFVVTRPRASTKELTWLLPQPQFGRPARLVPRPEKEQSCLFGPLQQTRQERAVARRENASEEIEKMGVGANQSARALLLEGAHDLLRALVR